MSKKTQPKYALVAGYLLTEPLEVTKIGGIAIEDDQQRPQHAKVLKVGDATWHDNVDRVLESPCKVGDTIVHSSVGFENVTIEGKELRMVPFGKVLMVKK